MTPASDPVADAIATLQRLTDLFVQRREQLAAEVGLTVAQWQVLEEIAREHFMPSLFARQRACTPANVSKSLRQLLAKGLVSVEISPSDGRQREYSLSAAGRAVMAELRARRAQAIDAVWRELPRADVAAFAAFGARLADRLEAYAADRGGQ